MRQFPQLGSLRLRGAVERAGVPPKSTPLDTGRRGRRGRARSVLDGWRAWGGHRFQWAVAGTFAVALAVRVTYNLTVERNYVPRHDAAAYVNLAQHLLKWGCYCLFTPTQPTTYRPPVYPLVLALVSLVSGPDPLHARLALSAIGALTCALVSLIARDLFGPRVGLLAGLVAATYPQLFIYDAWLYSESLAICLYAASCLAAMRAARRPTGWRWALVGGSLGLTALVRPNGIYALGAVVLWAGMAAWARLIPPRRALAGVLVAAAVCLAVMTPWTVRNYVVTGGAFVPISSGGGDVIAGAYNTAALYMAGLPGLLGQPLHDALLEPE